MKARSQRPAGSVLEQELSRGFARLDISLRQYDRAVLLGFLLSLLPIFPIVFVGFGLGVFHHVMHSAGRISDLDHKLAYRGLWIGAINSVLSILIVTAVLNAASSIDIGGLLQHPLKALNDITDAIFGIFSRPIHRRETTI